MFDSPTCAPPREDPPRLGLRHLANIQQPIYYIMVSGTDHFVPHSYLYDLPLLLSLTYTTWIHEALS